MASNDILILQYLAICTRTIQNRLWFPRQLTNFGQSMFVQHSHFVPRLCSQLASALGGVSTQRSQQALPGAAQSNLASLERSLDLTYVISCHIHRASHIELDHIEGLHIARLPHETYASTYISTFKHIHGNYIILEIISIEIVSC